MLKLKLNEVLSKGVIKAMNAAPTRTEEGIRRAMFRIALDMRNEAGKLAPYDRGHLRRSITYASNATTSKMGSNLVYARIQDLGGNAGRGHKVHIKPYKGRGYMTPAFEAQRDGKALGTIAQQLNSIFS